MLIMLARNRLGTDQGCEQMQTRTKSGTTVDDRVYVTVRYAPTKGTRRKPKSSSFTLDGCNDPEKVAGLIQDLIAKHTTTATPEHS